MYEKENGGKSRREGKGGVNAQREGRGREGG